MAKLHRIFLETRSVHGLEEYLNGIGGVGHLYLVYREVEIDESGLITNVVNPDDAVIRGGPAGTSVNSSPLAVLTNLLIDTLDGYGLPNTKDPDATPEDRRSLDITRHILEGGIYGDSESAWVGMSAFARGLNEQYRYELPDFFASEHISNSNATVLSVLNHAGVDVRHIWTDDGERYVDAFFSEGHPGADSDAATLLGSGASDEIRASANLTSGIALLGRYDRHDIFIGTPFSDRIYGEQAESPLERADYSATFDTVSYASASEGLIVRFAAGDIYTLPWKTEPLLIYGINPGTDIDDADLLFGIEQVSLSAHDDIVRFTDPVGRLSHATLIDGGEGRDTLDFSKATDGVTLSSVNTSKRRSLNPEETFVAPEEISAFELDEGYLFGERLTFTGFEQVLGSAHDDYFKVQHTSPERLTLDGGDGDDWVIALGGTGAITRGGLGRDFVFNTSAYGQLFGDSVDGQGKSDGAASASGRMDSDVFWYWPGTFIMDAKPNDILQFFGIPMLGGTNTVAGVYAGDGALAMDWLMPFVFYGYSQGGQLLIYNALMANVGPEDMKGIMVVEDYSFGGWKDASWGRPAAGDLGMTFRIAGGGEGAVEISAWRAIWGHLFTQIDVLWNLTKAIRWQPVDDPLVLDLDGDGIETVSKLHSGVYYDLDGDYFAEKTGWLSGDDGFLVLDRNGNGRIDDVSEMFGGPGRSGFSQLAEFDTDGDGLVTAADARFGELRVWRDLDGDGVTDAGELFTLDALGIVSLGVAGAALDIQTPQGNRLLASGSFTRTDGTTGAMYDMAFDTDPTDTIFRGERGVAEWLTGGVPGARRRVRGRGGRRGSPWRGTGLRTREDLACKLSINAF